MSIHEQSGAGKACDRSAGNGQGRRALAAAGLLLVVAAVAVFALTVSPEPAQACLLPGIPC